MLTTTVLTRQDGAQLASYYEDGVDDYYAKEGEASAWQGRAAEILKLSGPVDPRDFRMMLDGRIALGVYARTASNRHDSKERLGIDLTFSAPKSVSIQAFLGGDERIISAHDLAVARALEHAEERAQARAKVAGRSQTEVTGNLAIAKWRHETSREQDPQLHTHAVTMNFTRRSDGQRRALKNDEIVKSTKYLGAVYRTELAAELQKIGYELRHDPGGTFELAHISRQQIEAFSRRSRQVEANLAARGLDRDSATAGQKQVAALSTRERKVSVEREALYRRWNERAREAGIVLTKPEVSVGVAHYDHSPWRAAADAEAAKRAVAFAVAHHTERQAILTRSELVDTALKQGMGKVRLATIDAEVERRMSEGYLIREAPLYRLSDAKKDEPGKTARAWSAELVALGIDAREAPVRTEQAILRGRLVPAEARYTTQTALAREKAILALEAAGRGAATPIMPAETVRAHRGVRAHPRPGRRRRDHPLQSGSNRRRPGPGRHGQDHHAEDRRGGAEGLLGDRRGGGLPGPRDRLLWQPGPGAAPRGLRGQHPGRLPQFQGQGHQRPHCPGAGRGRCRPRAAHGAVPAHRGGGRRPRGPARRHRPDQGDRGRAAVRPTAGRRHAHRPHGGDPAPARSRAARRRPPGRLRRHRRRPDQAPQRPRASGRCRAPRRDRGRLHGAVPGRARPHPDPGYHQRGPVRAQWPGARGHRARWPGPGVRRPDPPRHDSGGAPARP